MEKMNWKFCQDNSDLILSCGIKTLLASKNINHIQEAENKNGNYLIFYKGDYFYIGEAKELRNRIRQQFIEKTSIFYKNYIDSRKPYEVGKIPILEFELKILYTNIGRKEIEEFGMVNLPTKLNKFERGKRKRVKLECNNNIWLQIQEIKEKLLFDGEKALFKNILCNWKQAIPQANAGIYYVKNCDNELIYIGESSNVFERYIAHNSTTYFSALRRHIGTEILGCRFIDAKKRKFTQTDDLRVNQFLANCKYCSMPISFGRFELEEYLIKKFKPLLNRKGNK